MDQAVAAYLIETWGKLGFKVSLREFFSKDGKYQSTGYKIYTDEVAGYDGLIEDCYTDAYAAGDFDVILLDVCQMTSSAFSTLAPFATEFCGSGDRPFGDDRDRAEGDPCDRLRQRRLQCAHPCGV